MSKPDLLEELRRIFREELDDHSATLEREAARLRAGLPGADARASAREIYRAVHSLKGAGRAVDFPDIEATAHAVESQLEAMLAGELDIARVARVATDTAAVLRELQSNWVRLGAGARAEAPRSPEPQPEQAPLSVEERRRAPSGPSAAGPSAPVVTDSVRVAVSRVAELTNASEELVGLAARAVRESKALEDALASLRGDIVRARQLSRRSGGLDLTTVLERAASTAHTVRLLLSAERVRHERWQRAVVGGVREVVDHARALRLVPLSTLAPALERAAEDAGRAGGKSVRLEVLGDGAEVDRRVRDGVREILLHLVRNAVDHGLEPDDERRVSGKPVPGRVTVRAEVVGREVHIAVEDDGRGVEVEALRRAAERTGRDTSALDDRAALALMFEAGLSTRGAVTAISGRGMGLDIVRQRVSELHGRAEVERRAPYGTRFLVVLPLDLGVLRGLVVAAGDVRLVLLSAAVLRLLRVVVEDVRSIEGRDHVMYREQVLPLVDLAEVLGRSRARRPGRDGEPLACAVVGAGERLVALAVDAFLEERDVVVRPMGPHVRRVPFVSSASVLDEGEVALIVDVAQLVLGGRARAAEVAEAAAPRRRVLVVDDSITTRQLVRSILEAAGYEVAVAADGEQAWALLVEAPVDVVVSDVEMPKVDGFQLLSRIRSSPRTAATPVVLVRALERDVDRQRAADLGATSYITKGSFDQEELLSTLEDLA